MTETAYQSFTEFYQDGCYSDFKQEHRHGGSFGIGMLEATQDDGDYTDPAIPQVSFVQCVVAPEVFYLDFGTGRRKHGLETNGAIGPQPSMVECTLQMDTRHTVRALHLCEGQFGQLLDRSDIKGDPLEPLYADFQNDAFSKNAFQQLWKAMQLDGVGSSLAVDGAFLTFLSHYLPNPTGVFDPGWIAGVEDARISRVVDYIEAHLGKQLLMSELSAVANLSEPQFARVFKANIGETAHAYVTERRIERAKRALLARTKPVTVIAYECGFGSSAHFSTTFKTHVGCTPRQFQQLAD